MALEEALDRAKAKCMPPLRKGLAQFFDGGIGRLGEHGQDQVLVRLDPSGSPVAAQSPRSHIALRSLQGPPSADTRRTHAEPFTRLPMAQAAINSRHNTSAKIK